MGIAISRKVWWVLLSILVLGRALNVNAQQKEDEGPKPTLGLDQGYLEYQAPNFRLKLVKASQTVAALQPKGTKNFDFTPADRLEKRNGDGYYHLGDLTLRLQSGDGNSWKWYSTAMKRHPVEPLDVTAPVLAGAGLNPTLPDDIPLKVQRYWKVEEDHLVLEFQLKNTSTDVVKIGGLGIPMVFNNILSDRDLEEAHAKCSFYDPYIGEDAGYLQVTRLNGDGPALVVVPEGDTPLEAYKPLESDSTQRGITFEGFYEWMVHTRAYEQNEWKVADNWNEATSRSLQAGETATYGVRFLLADSIRGIEKTLIENDRPVARGIPGYVVPRDQNARLFVKYPRQIKSIQIHPTNALEAEQVGTTPHGWKRLNIKGRRWGRARLTITYNDGLEQTVHYKVIKSEAEVVRDLGHFLLDEQWYDNAEDPFNRNPSVISYDYFEKEQVTEDSRVWIAGLSDEGGAGSWLAAMMKQLIQPNRNEIQKLQTFVDSVLWGGIQYSEGPRKYGVRKSLFYYAPDSMAKGTYSKEVNYGGWSSWDRKQARSVGRSYNYPHVAAAYWVFYRLARNHKGLVTNHSWKWYLERAYETSEAMVKYAPHYAQFGQMEGSVFLHILLDLKREGWNSEADSLEKTMKKRAEHWKSLAFPFGSEMPWDSTGQEEVYTWCKYFGFDQKARVTLNAILGYMPTVPNWGYDGSARRYWDFLFAGKLSRLERQLHHYGSGINAIPVLAEYRDHPDDYYLLRVGYGGLTGELANVTQDGFGAAALHAFPSTLKIDGYSGDYGTGFYGHAVNTGTYVINHPEFGWLAFGGNLEQDGEWINIKPLDSAQSRFYLAAEDLWITLDSGKLNQVRYNTSSHTVELKFNKATKFTPDARVRIHKSGRGGKSIYQPEHSYPVERDAYVVPLREQTDIRLVRK